MTKMKSHTKISVNYDNDKPVNGLGMMIGQYLEQNLEDSDKKVRQGLRLNVCTAIEVDKGISATIRFVNDSIHIASNVADDVDMHLKSSYTLLGDLLAGKVNPLVEVIKGNVEILKVPLTKPIQALRLFNFLKIPEELIIDTPKSRRFFSKEKAIVSLTGAAGLVGLAYLLLFL
ncbi:MAG: hypothetical protein GY866_10215 [Proteobacteria bacterium]|nr:hypothetical protein [Pseudomonadota bacterium]